MKTIKVAAAALNQTPMAWVHNTNNIIEAIEAAKNEGVELLCLPELCITGYGCEDMFHSKDVLRRAIDCLHLINNHTTDIKVSVGLPVELSGAVFNTACVMTNGYIYGFVAKKHLAGDGIHYEPRWFKPWPKGVVSELFLNNDKYLIGDIHFNFDGIKVGLEICEDAWVYDRPGRELASRGVDIILNPSASHFAFGKHEIRKGFVVEGSRAFNCAYVYANLLGNESGRIIFDGDTIIANNGKIITSGERFSYKDFIITSAVVDIDANNTARARTASFIPNVQEDHQCIKGTWYKTKNHIPDTPNTIGKQYKEYTKHEEFQKAVSLGLFDFMRKSKSNGYVVSLSGGADSSAVSALVYFMVKDALNDLGHDAFKSKLSYIQSIQNLTALKDIVNKLLTCVYQGSENSSNTTFTAAQKVAENIGAEFHDLNISYLVDAYIREIETSINRKLTWEADDITLQNIQARVRGPSVWMLANIKNAILLATSNRSEAAVGYATMDGDTCGGLSPIAGIDKNYLRSWLRHIERAIPALAFVNNQEPTAELRPVDKKQKDEDDLMPYNVLDQLEKHAIRDKRSPTEIFLLMKGAYNHLQLFYWIEKFFKLWCRNQWKRERYAPSFHLDDENLDPKTWCRFPIISGGFDEELADLKKIVVYEGDS